MKSAGSDVILKDLTPNVLMSCLMFALTLPRPEIVATLLRQLS